MTTPNSRPLALVGAEISQVLQRCDAAALARATDHFANASGRWFFTGQGRSGLVARMAAMRWMHLGRDAHFVGEVTTPAITVNDHMVAMSSSGSTPITLHMAELATETGADLIAVTGSPDNPLARLAAVNLVVPVAETAQFGGSLFEQCALIILDSVVIGLTGADAGIYREMAERHANLQ